LNKKVKTDRNKTMNITMFNPKNNLNYVPYSSFGKSWSEEGLLLVCSGNVTIKRWIIQCVWDIITSGFDNESLESSLKCREKGQE